MIFVAALDVAPAKSPASSITVRSPRIWASRAHPAPVAPPPITQTSNDLPAISWSCWFRDFINSPAPFSKCYFCAESEYRHVGYARICANVDVILKNRLDEEVRFHLKRIVCLKSLFRSKKRRARGYSNGVEWIADLGVHESKRNSILRPAWYRSVVAEPRGGLTVFPVEVSGAPVETNRGIETAVRSRLGAVQRLIRACVDQVVAAALNSGGVCKLAGIIRRAELVGARISFSTHLGFVLLVARETDFRGKHGRIPDREVEARGILFVRVAVAGENSRFNVQSSPEKELDLGRGRTCGVK